MPVRKLPDAPSRTVTEIGRGDYVLIGRAWKKVASNTAYQQELTPRHWTVITTDGESYGMYDINLYAKSEDLV